MSADHDQYFEYLQRRSRVGLWYRQHLLYPRLAKRLRGRVLDVGCGIGDMLAYRPNTFGTDINPKTVEFCRQRGLTASVMEPDRLPFDTHAFDGALLDNVLEHISAPAPLLAEIHRVVRPGGTLLVGVPGMRGYASDPDHKVAYDAATLDATVSGSGFRLVETFYTPLVRSEWLSRQLRQYCLYALFARLA